jgi:hypothetical protein
VLVVLVFLLNPVRSNLPLPNGEPGVLPGVTGPIFSFPLSEGDKNGFEIPPVL